MFFMWVYRPNPTLSYVLGVLGRFVLLDWYWIFHLRVATRAAETRLFESILIKEISFMIEQWIVLPFWRSQHLTQSWQKRGTDRWINNSSASQGPCLMRRLHRISAPLGLNWCSNCDLKFCLQMSLKLSLVWNCALPLELIGMLLLLFLFFFISFFN